VIVLAPSDTIAANSDVANAMTMTMFGMERTISSGAEAYKVLYQGQLASTPTTVYTAPAGTEAMIKTINVVNVTPSDNDLSVFRGGTAAANKIYGPAQVRSQGLIQYEDNAWRVVGARGGLLRESAVTLEDSNYTSMHAETLDRNFCTETNTAALVSGTLRLQAIWINAGRTISWISWHSATTALATGTNQLFGLYRVSDRALLAVTVNDGAAAWAANVIKTLRVTTPYTVTTTGLYYVAIMVAATTVPTLKGNLAITNGALQAQAPILLGTSNTGLTTTLPDPCNALTPVLLPLWAGVS
jgi:hypothetical protein